MKIKRIIIEKLFGLDDNDFDIECFPSEYVTILYAFNGIGKTTLLRLLDAILNIKMHILDSIPFKKISIYFDNNNEICVEKCGDYKLKFTEIKVKDLYKEKGVPIYPIRYCVMMDKKSDYYYLRFSEELKNAITSSLPEDIIKFRNKPINLLDFHYQNICSNGIFANKDYNRIMSNSVSFVSSDNFLDKTFGSPIFENFNTSDTIYFPKKLLADICNSYFMNPNNLKIDKSTMEYMQFQNSQDFPFQLEDKATRVCKEISKLIKERNNSELKLFLEIINNKFGFMYKNIELDTEKGLKAVPIYKGDPILDIKNLSSGEKNLIILFYELLFNIQKSSTEKQTIVFIDEPETSLHISWQTKVIKNILDICKKKSIQVIVATHSPDVIDNYELISTEMISKRYKYGEKYFES